MDLPDAGLSFRTVSLADVPDFAIGALTIRPALRIIEHGSESYGVQPRVMQVLVALHRASPDVVSRDRLVAQCWEGRIVGDDALNRCILALRALARDAGDQFEILNVPRVGYRLIVKGSTDAGPLAVPDSASQARSGRTLKIVSLVLLFAVAGAFIVLQGNPGEPRQADRLVAEGRALLRTGNPQVAGDARVKFALATKHDPDRAAAWAGLAEAIRSEAALKGPEEVARVTPQVMAHIDHSLRLDPETPEAHLLRGAVLGFSSAGARRHLRLAANLAPDSAEARVGLAQALRMEGDFAGELAELRRAAALDPDWYRPARDLAVATAEMGNRDGALAIARSVKLPTGRCAGPVARISWIYGDIAQAARCSAPGMSVETIWRAPDRVRFRSAQLTLGLSRDGAAAAPLPVVDTRPPQGRVWFAEAPTPRQWVDRNRSAEAARAWRMENLVAAKLMIAAGRSRELVSTYDTPTGLLGIARGVPVVAGDIPAAALVAAALHDEGRGAEAADLLRRAGAVVARARARGPVPFTFDRDAAGIAAVAGNAAQAIADLRRARSRGWVNNDWDDLLSLREEPEFRSLRDDARFEAIADELDRLYARERRQFVAFGLQRLAPAP